MRRENFNSSEESQLWRLGGEGRAGRQDCRCQRGSSRWCRPNALVVGSEGKSNRMKTRGQRFKDGAMKRAKRGTLGSQRRDKHAEDKWMSCTYDFVARNSNELSVLKGDVVEVLDDSKKWWKVQNSYSQVGYVPYNILTPLPTVDFSSTQNNTTIAQINGKSPVITKKTPPQPPPKSKGLYSNPNGKSWASTERLNMDVNERERFVSVNEELALRLANGTTGRCKSLQIQRTPETSVPLGYDSDPAQVHAWLEAKGFHPLTASALGVLNGAQLFSLKKDEFKAVSPEEGIRVYSQVTVQKALLEDSRKISELQAVMERQKRKVDSVTE